MKPAPAKTLAASDQLAVWVQRGLLLLVAIMPFHAFLSVWAGHLAGHQALWQSWKEALLVLLTAAAAILLAREPETRRRLYRFEIYAIATLMVIALVVTAIAHPGIRPVAYGLKTDLEFLVAFGLALLVATEAFSRRVTDVLLLGSGVVIAFGILQATVLPHNVLAHFGYGPHTILPYELVAGDPSAVRILSTLGGPNQLGSFLILPICLVAWRLLTRPRWWHAVYLLAGLAVEWYTYSRSALLGLVAALIVLGLVRLPRRWRPAAFLGLVLLGIVTVSFAITTIHGNHALQKTLLHQSIGTNDPRASSTEHLSSSRAGLAAVEQHPLGLGLGAAGPASFHGTNPFIPEDYYLQIALETGVLGLAAFVVAQVVLGFRLWQAKVAVEAAPAALAALVGIAVINLALHGWADSSTALTYWILAGAAAGSYRATRV